MARLVPIVADKNLSKNRPVIELTKWGKLLCYEECSGRWFRSSQWKVEDALAQLQGLYENLWEVNLNDLYSLLDIQETSRGAIYGWNARECGEHLMLFETELIERGFMTMDEPVLVLTPATPAEKDYKDHF